MKVTQTNGSFIYSFNICFLYFLFPEKLFFNENIDCERIQGMQQKGNDLHDLTTRALNEQRLQ